MSSSYELPPELWEIVMTHFHSIYKKPLIIKQLWGVNILFGAVVSIMIESFADRKS